MLKAKMGEAVKRPATDSRDTYSFFHPSRFVRHLRLWIGPRERFFFLLYFVSLYIFLWRSLFTIIARKNGINISVLFPSELNVPNPFLSFSFFFFGRMPGWIVLSYKPVTRQGRTLERERAPGQHDDNNNRFFGVFFLRGGRPAVQESPPCPGIRYVASMHTLCA